MRGRCDHRQRGVARVIVGIGLSREAAQEATTLRQFRHLLEKQELTKVFEVVNGRLSAAGLIMREETIADATMLVAPPSVKNEARLAPRRCTKRRRVTSWYLGIEADIGLDANREWCTPWWAAANVADVTQTRGGLHGEEKTVYLDTGYTAVEEREELKERELAGGHEVWQAQGCAG